MRRIIPKKMFCTGPRKVEIDRYVRRDAPEDVRIGQAEHLSKSLAACGGHAFLVGHIIQCVSPFGPTESAVLVEIAHAFSSPSSRDSLILRGGVLWWPRSYAELAAGIGIPEAPVRAAISKLAYSGWIDVSVGLFNNRRVKFYRPRLKRINERVADLIKTDTEFRQIVRNLIAGE